MLLEIKRTLSIKNQMKITILRKHIKILQQTWDKNKFTELKESNK